MPISRPLGRSSSGGAAGTGSTSSRVERAGSSRSSNRASRSGSAAVSRGLAVRPPAARGSAAGRATTVLFVASVARDAAPLSDLFPTIFHVPADGSRSSRRIVDLVRLIEDEIAEAPGEAGSGAVVDHLGDLILIELLRVETRRAHQPSPVWVQGIVDPAVARV